VTAALHRAGIDPRRMLVPVAPAAHYTMGGIATGLDGEASVPGLLAVGECACNGLHGANRLASNSLAECFVFGRRAALAAAALERGGPPPPPPPPPPRPPPPAPAQRSPQPRWRSRPPTPAARPRAVRTRCRRVRPVRRCGATRDSCATRTSWPGS
jgi:L-aspartate oxidase